jgi:cation transport ATPase
MMKRTDMAHEDVSVNPPLGGYILTAMFWFATALMPIAGFLSIARGDVLAGVAVAVLGTPMFYWMGRKSPELNRDAREYREYLRANHHWASAAGVMVRLAVIGIFVLAVVIQSLFFNPVSWFGIAMLGIFLLFSSVLSTALSGYGKVFALR